MTIGKHFVPRNSGRNSEVVIISEWSKGGVLLYVLNPFIMLSEYTPLQVPRTKVRMF